MTLLSLRPSREWDPFEEMSYRYPPVDMYDDKDSIVVKAELPGLKKDAVSIEIKDHVLILSGERKREKEIKDENYYVVECAYGSFSRSFSLPRKVDVDKVSASYKDGILQITLPKSEKAKLKAIPIEVA